MSKQIASPYVPTDADWAFEMRRKRDALLVASDWTQMHDSPLTDEQRAAWATYRQQLRDAPATWTPGLTWDPAEPPA